MSRPVTLFTGQWADLPLEDMCRKASDFGYQGLELACWGDHFEINKAVADYRASLLKSHPKVASGSSFEQFFNRFDAFRNQLVADRARLTPLIQKLARFAEAKVLGGSIVIELDGNPPPWISRGVEWVQDAYAGRSAGPAGSEGVPWCRQGTPRLAT